jgi:hypothetical protein
VDGYAIAAIAPVLALIPAWLVAIAAVWWVLQLFITLNFFFFALVMFFSGAL